MPNYSTFNTLILITNKTLKRSFLIPSYKICIAIE